MAEVLRMPRLSDTMTEGKIVNWNKKVGDKIKPGDVLAEVETDKATMELESYNEGTLLYIGVEAGSAVIVDGILAVVGKEGEEFQSLLQDSSIAVVSPTEAKVVEAVVETVAAEEVTSVSSTEDDRIKASPLAKKIAADKGIDLSKLTGSGDGGRVIKKDVDQYTPMAAPQS